ncbi:PPE domain-containing protein [Streptomyces thermolineatus]|uniref:PPE domain-containing protein n=1 Tax=Streptomyces thermolineatus TaxID=44033 RepID=A0ABP5Z3W1_9ACTN
MIEYEQLYHLSLSNLKEAVERWGKVPGKFKGLHTSFTDQVQKPFRDAEWSEPAPVADYAASRIFSCRQEYEDAGIESKGIHGVLLDTYEELKKAKEDLHRLADEEARQQGLHVSSTGQVTVRESVADDPAMRNDPGRDEMLQKEQQKVDALVKRINAVLDRAADTDDAAVWALRRVSGKGKDGFNDRSVPTSLDSADAQRATQLAGLGEKMTDKQLAELQDIVNRNRKSPEFTTAFYDSLGPKGTLETLGKLSTQVRDSDKERQGIYKNLQKDLGISLATATDPDNKPHLGQEWSEALRKAGSQELDIPKNGINPYGRGYQVLGEIIRYGAYDPRFLVPVAEHAAQLQEKRPGEFPITGFMEALGHSPDAATEFFNSPFQAYDEEGKPKPGAPDLGKDGSGAKITNYLDFFTDKDYHWVGHELPQRPAWAFGDWETFDKDYLAYQQEGPDALGHALEAAVSGRAYDDPDAKPQPHSGAQAALMHDVVEKFGTNTDLISAKDETPWASMNDSLGNMTAEYMFDFQRAMGGGDRNSEIIFPVNGIDAQLDTLNNGPLKNFLGEVAKDPDAYGAIVNAQQAATTESIKNVISLEMESKDTSGIVHEVVRPGAVIEGIISESRATAVYEEKIAEDEKFNKGLEEGSKWTGRIIEMGVSRIPIVGDVTKWAIEDTQEGVQEKYKQDSKESAGNNYDSYLESNRENVAQSARNAALNASRQAGLSREVSEALAASAYSSADSGYSAGRVRQQGIGQ